MALPLTRKRFTIEEYHRLAEIGVLDWDERLELIEGTIMTMHPTTRRLFSPDDLRVMAEHGIISADEQVDLIEGEIIEVPRPGGSHAQHLDRISNHLRGLMDEASYRYGGVTLEGQKPLRIHNRLELRPDLSLITPRVDMYPLKDQGKEEVSLIIEVGDRDLEYQREVRLPIYARHACFEVWLVNPDRRWIDLHIFANPADGTFEYVERLGRGESIGLQNVNITVKVEDFLG